MPFDLEADERRAENRDAEPKVPAGGSIDDITGMIAFLARYASESTKRDGPILKDDWAEK